ncbi:MAG TPA: helix-turn-helix domain-containing protein [Actinophytocola sp.]|uniref:nSTAND1 domain-containing NTPase n=1 Tax=Actinophytocola sp. TaxID=1872138 RepID=UPI002DBE2E1E|nr:helix-turn-helix domain-containing protein [Actinophytocola sp.]HEU5469255.1 helix-turn-helix domain-containing protein [Actinophytocola sp.]
MGRQENPLDPATGPVERFAYQLRLLRQDSGLTYRAMAQRVEYSAPALSQAAAGRQLPTLPVAMAYVTACGGDVQDWKRRWRQAVDDLSGQRAESGETVSPYLGLARFEPGDRDRFFGRDRLVDSLLTMVREQRFVALVGPSGSGKSSLLRAGLIPALGNTANPATIRILTPGTHPASQYADLVRAADDAPETVVIVDQFEELFTLCRDLREQDRFIGLLLAARRPQSRLRVVVAIRADFYGRCAEHRRLATAVARAHLLVGPMTRGELREVIVKPATAEGLVVERALTARLIDEVAGEPGGLPLLSHVLAETWQRRRGRALTMEGYEAAGGVHGALTRTAEDFYVRLSSAQAAVARRLLLRLVTPGQDGPDTRRPAKRVELIDTAPDDATVVLDQLARARLVSLDGDTVDLAHEALITAWPRLKNWIENDRERLRFHQQLAVAAHAWAELGHESGALYRGARLVLTRDWLATDGAEDDLSPAERAFVTASIHAEDAERAATVRNHRRLRLLAGALAVLLVAATTMGVVALDQRRRADQVAKGATSRQLAAQALGLFETQPGTAMLLATEAYRIAPTTEARSALLTITAHGAYQGELTGHTDAISRIAFSPDGKRLASVSKDHTLALVDLQRRDHRTVLTEHNTWLRALAFSPNGQLLATGGDDSMVMLWNANTGTPVATLAAHTRAVKAIAFSPDGATLASASLDHTVVVWDLHTRLPIRRLVGNTGPAQTVAYSPAGDMLATGGGQGAITLWDSTTGAKLATITAHTRSVDSLAFSPDGALLASTGPDQTVKLWDTVRRAPVATLTGHSDEVRVVAFSPDGRTLASAGHDRTIILWDLAHRSLRVRLTGHANFIYTLAFHPHLPLLASGEENSRVILWDPTRIPLTGHTETVTAIGFSPDGRTLASASADRTVLLWDREKRTLSGTMPVQPGPLTTVTFSPDGRLLAVGGGSPQQAATIQDQTLTLWDVTHPANPIKTADLRGHTDQIRDVAFSPDGRTLASVSTDQQLILWDTRQHTRLATLTAGSVLNSVVFSPDGHALAATSHGQTAELWNAGTHTHIATLPHNAIARGLAFSPDSRTLATAGIDGTVSLWDIRQQRAAPTTLAQAETLNSIAFSPDNRTLTTGSVERTVDIWDTAARARLATLTGHAGPVIAVAYSPDGRTLATASTDKTITLWDTDPPTAITTICDTLDRDLSPEEWTKFLPSTPYRPTCSSR